MIWVFGLILIDRGFGLCLGRIVWGSWEFYLSFRSVAMHR